MKAISQHNSVSLKPKTKKEKEQLMVGKAYCLL